MNVSLSSTISPTNKKINRRNIFLLAHFFVKTEKVKFSYALKRAYKEAKGRLERNFWTDATQEDIDYIIKNCSRKNKALINKIMKWDSPENQHPLDWLPYQLRRQGFKITGIKADKIIKRDVPTIDISLLKSPKMFNKLDNSFILSNGLTYCLKGDYVCV